MTSVIIGVDPGLDGAMVRLDRDGRVISVMRASAYTVRFGSKREYRPDVLARALRAGAEGAFGVIERQQPFPKQGVVSTWRTGMGYGLWVGLFEGMRIPYAIVLPRDWQSVMLKGIPGKGKVRSVMAASRLFPDVEIGNHDGVADALLIAEFGRIGIHTAHAMR